MIRSSRKTCRSCNGKGSRNYQSLSIETDLFDSHDKQQLKSAPIFSSHRKEPLTKSDTSIQTVQSLFYSEKIRRLLCLIIAFGLTVYVLLAMLSYQDRKSQLIYKNGKSDAKIIPREQSITSIEANDYNKYLEDYIGIMKDINQDLKQMIVVNKELIEANKHFKNFISSILLDFRSDLNFLKNKLKDQEKYGSTVEDNSVKFVHHELELYDADKIGMPDFALESSGKYKNVNCEEPEVMKVMALAYSVCTLNLLKGGSVISTPGTETYQLESWYFMMKMPLLRRVTRSPRKVIQPSVSPGECWPFVGSRGSIILQLAAKIIITAVTLEHIPVILSLTGKIDSAPRNFTIFGLENLNEIGTNLGHYFYDTQKAPRQTFFIKSKKETTINPFVGVRLTITSNHGNPDFTCVYRFRVHGHIYEDKSL